jgi:hypothetical protein
LLEVDSKTLVFEDFEQLVAGGARDSNAFRKPCCGRGLTDIRHGAEQI